MKRLFKWLFRLVILLIVLGVALVLLKDTIAKGIMERQIRFETGLDARIGRLEIGIVNPTVTIENVRLYNTAEFGGSPFVDLAELHLEYNRAALATRKLRFALVRLNLA